MVSIPIGFSGSLQHLTEPCNASPDCSMFQSLSGFLVRCNSDVNRAVQGMSDRVSIPIGFSGSLQHRMRWYRPGLGYEFQSLSGFRFVATLKDSPKDGKPLVFQSLSGFLVRCNIAPIAIIEPFYSMFKSYRVFRPLQRSKSRTPSSLLRYWFQSLWVFWFAATIWLVHDAKLKQIGFNPYRVFSFAATSGSLAGPIQPREFESLSGFLVRCNPRMAGPITR